jgi:hypothetical protein
MSGGGTKTTQQQQSTSSNTLDPQYKSLLMGNYATAQNNAGTLSQPYTGQLTAGFTPTQLQAQGVLSGVATDPRYAANNNQAISGTQGVLNNPVNGQITANPVNASTIANTDLSPYLNPYTNDVINTTIADQERARQIAQVADAQKATAAGAFGGSRSGVMAAGTNDAYDRNTASLLAGLNQANYANAQGLAGQDVNTKNNMGQFNAGQNLTAQQNTVANNLAANNQTLSAAGQLAGLNNNSLALATQQGGLLGSVGDIQQQQNQAELSNAYNNWLTGKQLTLQQQNLLNSALGLIPVQQTVNSSGSGTTTQKQSLGFGDILSGVGGLLGGVGALGSGGLI